MEEADSVGTDETLFAYANGELGEKESLDLEGRLGRSPDLRREVERYERLIVLLGAAAEEDMRAPDDLAARVNRRVLMKAYIRAASGIFEGIIGAYGRAVLYYLR